MRAHELAEAQDHSKLYLLLLARSFVACSAWNSLQYAFLRTWLTNGTFTRRDSILAETEFVNRATSDTDPYDQYEFSIRIEHVGHCMERVSTD